MNANEYQEQAKRTLIDGKGIREVLLDREIMILWNAIGVGGEAGEILELVKKGVLHRHWQGWLEKSVVEEVGTELGDLMWYIAGLCTVMGISLGDVMERNILKLRARYPEGWDYNRSQHRQQDLVAEDNSSGIVPPLTAAEQREIVDPDGVEDRRYENE